MDTIQQQKEALRRELAAAERAMMPEEKRLSDGAILRHVLNTQEYRLARTVFAFVGRADEIDTRPLLEQILADGKRLCVPLCTSPGVMECREVPDLAVLRPGAYGISEPPDNAPAVPPECVDLAIIPCAGAAADAADLGAAAVTTTDFWPGIPATRCCCAGKGFCVRIFRRKHTTSASPLL